MGTRETASENKGTVRLEDKATPVAVSGASMSNCRICVRRATSEAGTDESSGVLEVRAPSSPD